MSKHRKIVLLAILGIILAYFAGEWLYETVLEGPKQERLDRAERVRKKIAQRERDLSKAREIARQLEDWESQSLPSDPEIARSYYHAWLMELVKFAGFANPNVDAGNPMGRKGLYLSIGFSIRATAKLQQLTTFLFEFYNAGHLHQVRSINITPLPRRDDLDLTITIEALILPTADRKDQLATVRADRLAFTQLSDYDIIARRNLFDVSHGVVHPTDQTFLTAVVMIGERPQAWFSLRSTDEVLRLFPGDPLAIGQFQGTVYQIEGHDVIVESDGERWLMTIGENLGQALALPPEF